MNVATSKCRWAPGNAARQSDLDRRTARSNRPKPSTREPRLRPGDGRPFGCSPIGGRGRPCQPTPGRPDHTCIRRLGTYAARICGPGNDAVPALPHAPEVSDRTTTPVLGNHTRVVDHRIGPSPLPLRLGHLGPPRSTGRRGAAARSSGRSLPTVDGSEREMVAGSAAVVPPNTPHSVRIIGPAEIVVADFPVRHDLPGVPTT